MKLTVLGHYGPYPAAGGACSGYLIEAEGAKVLLDCGSGVMSRLVKTCSLSDLDLVVLTHLHGDHMSDILVLRYAIDRLLANGERDEPLPVYAPEAPFEVFGLLSYKQALVAKPIVSDMQVSIGALEIRFASVDHPVPTFGLRLAERGSTFAYSSDTSYCSSLLDLARGANLLLCEASLLEGSGANVGHLTSAEAGRAAREAAVGRLLLTHIFPEHSPTALLDRARSEFPEVELVTDLNRYEV